MWRHLVTLNLLRLEQQITRHCGTLWSHSYCCADRWSGWLTPALTLHRCKYSTHIIPVWASGHRSTVTFRFNLYMSSAIWSPSQPTSPNAGLCLHFAPTARCLLWLAYYSRYPPFLPLNQSGRTCLSTAASDRGPQPLKRHGAHSSAPEVAFALLKYIPQWLSV